MTPTICKNPFIDGDGFCTQCGQNHFKVTKRGEIKPPAKPAKPAKISKSVAEIDKIISENPLYDEARKTVELLESIYHLGVKTVFRNRQGSAYRIATKQIIFGYQNLEWEAKEGFLEYQTVENVLPWPRDERKGLKAVQLVAIHEYAHALDRSDGGTHFRGGRNIHHGPAFQRAYSELIALFF